MIKKLNWGIAGSYTSDQKKLKKMAKFQEKWQNSRNSREFQYFGQYSKNENWVLFSETGLDWG